MILLLRALAITAGLGAIAAVTYGTVEATGGFGTHYAAIYIALGVIQAVLAMLLGAGLVRGRGIIALTIGILVMCEAANFLATVDLQLLAAEDAAAPLHDADAKHKAAVARLAAAEQSDKVQRAEAAKALVDREAMTASAGKSCRDVCRDRLTAASRDAQAAVDDAKREIQLDLQQARAALDKAPVPPSATPLADRTGWQGWVLDLVRVGFRGFAVAIGAAVLLAAGTLHTRERPVAIEARNVIQLAPPAAKVGDVDAFMLERVTHERGARVAWAAAFLAYRSWCGDYGVAPVDARAFGARLDTLRTELGLKAITKGQDVFFVDLKLAS